MSNTISNKTKIFRGGEERMSHSVLRPSQVLEGKDAIRFIKLLSRERSPGEIVRHNKFLKECEIVYDTVMEKKK